MQRYVMSIKVKQFVQIRLGRTIKG